jgi:outer membrane protein TolC
MKIKSTLVALSLLTFVFAPAAYSKDAKKPVAKPSSRSSGSSGSSGSKTVKVSLSQVVSRVSSQNLMVQANAQKVYQAKQSVAVARGNLLPKLNLWRIITAPLSLVGALGVVEDIAPFMIPGNWFAAKAQKVFYNAEVEGFRTLKANQIMTAKSTYIHLSYDQSLLRDIEVSKAEVKQSLDFVKAQEDVGVVPQGTSAEIEIRYLALNEDARSVQALINEERATLANLMGYSASANLEIDTASLPTPSSSDPINSSYSDFESRALSAAPELRQYHYLVWASQYVKKETRFSMFGLSTLSSGVAGGIFDNVPRQDGLGFGTGASVAVSKAQTRTLEIQKEGAAETVKRNLRVAVDQYNLDIENYDGVSRRVELTETIQQSLNRRLELGELVPIRDIIEASRNRIQAISSRSEARARFLINQDRINRLTMRKDYDDTGKAVPIKQD